MKEEEEEEGEEEEEEGGGGRKEEEEKKKEEEEEEQEEQEEEEEDDDARSYTSDIRSYVMLMAKKSNVWSKRNHAEMRDWGTILELMRKRVGFSDSDEAYRFAARRFVAIQHVKSPTLILEQVKRLLNKERHKKTKDVEKTELADAVDAAFEAVKQYTKSAAATRFLTELHCEHLNELLLFALVVQSLSEEEICSEESSNVESGKDDDEEEEEEEEQNTSRGISGSTNRYNHIPRNMSDPITSTTMFTI
eukprot:g8178.t1